MKTKRQVRRYLLGRLLVFVASLIPVVVGLAAGCGNSCPGGSFSSTQCFKWPPPAGADGGGRRGHGW